LLLNEFPDILHPITFTSFKTPRDMENEVTSRICDLILETMFITLQFVFIKSQTHVYFTTWLTSVGGISEGPSFLPKNVEHAIVLKSGLLTTLVIYDGLYAFCYTTGLFKKCCLA